jgi:hypothetical protein
MKTDYVLCYSTRMDNKWHVVENIFNCHEGRTEALRRPDLEF